MNIQGIIKRAIEDEDFAKELHLAAVAAAGKDRNSKEFQDLLAYFSVDSHAAEKMTPDPAGFISLGGLTTMTTTTTYTTAACTTTGTTTTTTGN